MKGHFLLCFLLFYSCTTQEKNPILSDIQADFDQTWMSVDSAKTDSIRSRIAAIRSLNEYTLYCRSWLLSKKGNKAKALKTADSLVMGFPAFTKGYYLRANLRAEVKDLEGALADYDRTIKRDPVFFEAYMNRGSLQFSRKHPDEALKDFQAALKLRVGNQDALYNLGNARMALGQPDSACTCWEKSAMAGDEKSKALITKFCSKAE